MDIPIAVVGYSCGRSYLQVGGVVVAMEGDPCRTFLPEGIAEEISEEELSRARIGGKPCKDLPLNVVRFFRGECWTKRSLEWTAMQINEAAREAAKGKK